MSNVINQIKTLLGIEVKLEQMKLDNGTVLEAESFEAGQPVFIVNEEDRIALPIGEYTLEDGRMLIVQVEGEIAEVKDAMPQEEAPVEEAPVEEAPEVEVEVEAEAAPSTPKKIVESTVKESHFSKEDVDALKAEIENLKTELASLKEVKEEVVEVELAQTLKHNPNQKTEREVHLYAQNSPQTTLTRVLNKLNK